MWYVEHILFTQNYRLLQECLISIHFHTVGKLNNLETSTVLAKKCVASSPSSAIGIEHLVSVANV